MQDHVFMSRKDVLTRSLINTARSKVETLADDCEVGDWLYVMAYVKAVHTVMMSSRLGSSPWNVLEAILRNLWLKKPEGLWVTSWRLW